MADGEGYKFCHLPSAICHPPSAICHPPSAIRHPPSAIRVNERLPTKSPDRMTTNAAREARLPAKENEIA
jgi:hypothetical protein